LMEVEWKKQLARKALERVQNSVSPQSVEVFRRLLDGEGEGEVARSLGLQTNSVNRIKNRMKARMVAEIAQLCEEFE